MRTRSELGRGLTRLEAQITVNNITYKEVADRFTSSGITEEELIKHFTIYGVFTCRVLPRYGIWQGTKWDEKSQLQTMVRKLRCIDHGLASGTNVVTETQKTITTLSFALPAEILHEMCRYRDMNSIPVPAATLGLNDIFAAYRTISIGVHCYCDV